MIRAHIRFLPIHNQLAKDQLSKAQKHCTKCTKFNKTYLNRLIGPGNFVHVCFQSSPVLIGQGGLGSQSLLA